MEDGMKLNPESEPVKKAPSRMEAKNEQTTKAARLIIDSELSKRVAKTERLRAARLAQEAVDAAAAEAAPKKPAKAPRKKAAATKA